MLNLGLFRGRSACQSFAVGCGCIEAGRDDRGRGCVSVVYAVRLGEQGRDRGAGF